MKTIEYTQEVMNEQMLILMKHLAIEEKLIFPFLPLHLVLLASLILEDLDVSEEQVESLVSVLRKIKENKQTRH